MDYLLYANVYGTQEQVKQHPIFKTLYKNLYDVDFDNTFFALNLNLTFPEKILDHPYKKIIISYHSEHIHYQNLYDIAVNNQDKEFLILSDFSSFNIKDDEAESDFWPDNVTTIQWLSWGEQIEVAKKIAGAAKSPNIPTKKISSLSNRHEYHKAAITAFIINNFDLNNLIVSWHNWKKKEEIYYLANDVHIHDEIKKHIFSKKFLEMGSLTFDDFNNSKNEPILNTYWSNPAYLNCAVNITNESTFSSIGQLNDGKIVTIPGPFITEKTLKPLLSGTAFLHVGQPFLLTKLNELGISTDFGFPADYDDEPFEDERILKIYDSINFIMNTPLEKLYQNSYDAIVNNLDCIKSGLFYKNCENHNKKNIKKIYEWSLINP